MASILVVDDEPLFLEQIAPFLIQLGHQVQTAPDGISGLKKASESDFSLIFLDVVMPGLDGFQVLKRLSETKGTNRIPVVMLTAKGETESILRGQQFGAVDYLIKPFSVEDIKAVLRRFIL